MFSVPSEYAHLVTHVPFTHHEPSEQTTAIAIVVYLDDGLVNVSWLYQDDVDSRLELIESYGGRVISILTGWHDHAYGERSICI